jgi:energy-coupling factor transport system permease protein
MLTGLDPLAKLGVALVYVGFATLNQDLGSLLSVSALMIVLLLVAERMPLRALLWATAPFAFFAATSSWIYALAPDPTHARVPGAGWGVAAIVSSRTIAMGLVSVLFAWTTEPADLARALAHRLRLPGRFVHGALAATQFLPGLAEEARMARLVARASLPRPVSRLRLVLAGLGPGLLLTLLAGAIRRAGTAALAMELRGASLPGPHSAWRVPRFKARDLVFVAVALAVLAAIGLLPPGGS